MLAGPGGSADPPKNGLNDDFDLNMNGADPVHLELPEENPVDDFNSQPKEQA